MCFTVNPAFQKLPPPPEKKIPVYILVALYNSDMLITCIPISTEVKFTSSLKQNTFTSVASQLTSDYVVQKKPGHLSFQEFSQQQT